MPLSLLNHSALALFAQRTRIPTSARSTGFCAIWVCISSSSTGHLAQSDLHLAQLVGCWVIDTQQNNPKTLCSFPTAGHEPPNDQRREFVVHPGSLFAAHNKTLTAQLYNSAVRGL